MDKLEYERLKPYCKNELHRERLDALFKYERQSKAARALGVSKTAVAQTISVIKLNAARQGSSPDEDLAGIAPPGFVVKGKSILHDHKTGKPILSWTKTREDTQIKHETLVESIQEASQRIEALPPVPTPRNTNKDLLAVYPYGDPHVGMYAWNEDAEDDFDLDKAVSIMTTATQDLVASAPPAQSALIMFLGDFFHSDNQSNKTNKSGFQLDVDSRWSKVLRIGVNIAVSLIHLALTKHKKAHVIVEIGNHDDHSAIMLAVCLDAFFKDNKRVTIDLSPARFHYYKFGKNLIGSHHGDLVKPAQLPGLMATDKPKEWGETTHRVWYTGHIHNQTRYDLPGCEVESFRILPPRDVHAQSHGYRSGRSMDCIIRHKERGEIARHTVHA